MLNTIFGWLLVWICAMSGIFGIYLVIDAIQRFNHELRIKRFQRKIEQEFKNDENIIKK